MVGASVVASVLDPGPLTIFVDEGRHGWAHLAVPSSGAYDRSAFTRANRLVGNAPGSVVLEVLMGPLSLHFHAAATLAFTGVVADIEMLPMSSAGARAQRSSGHAVAGHRGGGEATFTLTPGTELRIGSFRRGARGYLAIRGGWAAAMTLGSASTDTLSGLGPAPLGAGQHLNRRESAMTVPHDEVFVQPPPSSHVVCVDPPPLWGQDAPRWLVDRPWQVAADSDRIGMRLSRDVAPIHDLPRPPLSAVSVPLVRGAVQVTPDGIPVIMGPDHPTTGGYPVAGVIHGADSDSLAQARPGDEVVFVLPRD